MYPRVVFNDYSNYNNDSVDNDDDEFELWFFVKGKRVPSLFISVKMKIWYNHFLFFS